MSDYELRRHRYKNEILNQQLWYEYGSFYTNHECCGSVQLGEVLNLASVRYHVLMYVPFLTYVKYMIFMTLLIIVKKPYDFQGGVVTGEEVAHSKFFKLSEV